MNQPADKARIGDYEIVSQLEAPGRELYYGLKGRQRAILASFNLAPSDKQGFRDEVARASVLTHEGLVRIVESFDSGDQHVLVFETVDGISLLALLEHLKARGERLPDGAVTYIGSVIMAALATAHAARDEDGRSKPLVHGEIGPHQVFINWDGEPKLMGLGLSKVFRLAHHHGETPPCARSLVAPEVRAGKAMTPRSNAYSAARMMWSIFTLEEAPDNARTPSLKTLRPELPSAVSLRIDQSLTESVRARLSCALLSKTLAKQVTQEDKQRLAELMSNLRTRRISAGPLPRESIPPTRFPQGASLESLPPLSDDSMFDDPTAPFFQVPVELQDVTLPTSSLPPPPAPADDLFDDDFGGNAIDALIRPAVAAPVHVSGRYSSMSPSHSDTIVEKTARPALRPPKRDVPADDSFQKSTQISPRNATTSVAARLALRGPRSSRRHGLGSISRSPGAPSGGRAATVTVPRTAAIRSVPRHRSHQNTLLGNSPALFGRPPSRSRTASAPAMPAITSGAFALATPEAAATEPAPADASTNTAKPAARRHRGTLASYSTDDLDATPAPEPGASEAATEAITDLPLAPTQSAAMRPTRVEIPKADLTNTGVSDPSGDEVAPPLASPTDDVDSEAERRTKHGPPPVRVEEAAPASIPPPPAGMFQEQTGLPAPEWPPPAAAATPAASPAAVQTGAAPNAAAYARTTLPVQFGAAQHTAAQHAAAQQHAPNSVAVMGPVSYAAPPSIGAPQSMGMPHSTGVPHSLAYPPGTLIHGGIVQGAPNGFVPTRWVAIVAVTAVAFFVLGILVASGGLKLQFGDNTTAPASKPAAVPAPEAKAAVAVPAPAAGSDLAPGATAAAAKSAATGESQNKPDNSTPPTAASEAKATPSEAEDDAGEDADPSLVDAKALAPNAGYLIVNAPYHPTSGVYWNGRHVGTAGKPIAVLCGAGFLRIGDVPLRRWHSEGRSVSIPCQNTKHVTIDLWRPAKSARRGQFLPSGL